MRQRLLFIFLLGFSYFNIKAQTKLSFFNEMKSEKLVDLFKDSSIIPTLHALHAEIRMGILDLTPERAGILQKLNQDSIPVVAWLLLPEESGYWFHSGNGDKAIERYREIKKWTIDNNIHFSGIGLDLELDYNDITMIKEHPLKFISKLPARLYDKTELNEGTVKYAALIDEIKKDGYNVESYYASFIKDETALGNTSIQQLTKFLDIKTDKEIPMLYSSFMGNPDGLLKIYGMDAGLKQVAIGSTGGGVDSSLPTLSFDELVHDLDMASKFADEIHIFSLEGCVQNGYLQKLLQYKSNTSREFDQEQIKSVRKLQKIFITVSKVLSHPTILFLSIFLIFVLVIWLIYFIIKTIIRLLKKS